RGILRAGTGAVRGAYPGLDAGLAAREARFSPGLTAHDGRIEPRPELLDPRVSGRVVSNSILEGLAACPLSYFYSKVLRVRPPDDPELDPAVWLNAAERGSLLHDVYEHALRRAREREIEPADDAFEAVALEVLAEQVDRWRGKVPAPSEVVVSHEVDALRADARSFARHVREDEGTWIDLESVFGYGRGQDPVTLEIAGGELRVCGRMDRIDERKDGRLEIVDYKSGSTFSYSARFGTWHGGRHLQHLLYTRVAAILYGKPVAGMTYHFPSVRGQNQRIPYGVERLAEGERVLEALCDLIARGLFVASDEADDCKWCDHRKICRVEIDDWNAITSPPADWAKAHGEGIEEYGGLLKLRKLDR
ncbi:MAG TPA: PD-(D/E)XK nuclease family protein, partial [Gemmatimonadota bacterium]|nr:PD-(D/E)XK nuclease family protein [Gemmatimonadota bacterium]